MLALILFVLLSIFSITVEAQLPSLPTDANFYDYLDAYYSSPSYNPSDTSEGGSRTQHNRLASIWVSRLHPHGDFSVANKAIINYAQNFTPVTNSNIEANWNCIGPSNTPVNGGGKGVGQIHRITFSPNYAISDNTIYACSGFGGLWRTEDDGAYWQNVNTDGLKISSVADVAISYDDINDIFIATGLADGGVTLEYGPNWGNTNPIYTIGIYRSTDYGETWDEINEGFLDKFYEEGGVVRKLTIDKNDPDILFAATSNGIYRTTNALDPIPDWEMVYDGETDFDGDFRSIEFKPDDSNVLYASSINIFKSIDGGDNWDEITGNTTGLDFEALALDGFYPERINLAVTPAPGGEDRIYAYIFGENESLSNGISGRCIGMDYKSAYIYNFENGMWNQHIFQHGYNSKEWMAMAVSPVDADIIFAYGALTGYGDNSSQCSIGVYGTYPLPSHPWGNYSGFVGSHDDGHVLAFQPNVSDNPLIFYGSHGGVGVLDQELLHPPPPFSEDAWEYRNNGLQNQLFWSFAHSNFEEGVYLTANQDCGIYKYKDNVWKPILSTGDGYSAKASYNNPDLFFHSNGNSTLGNYNITTGHNVGYEVIPIDPVSLDKTLIPKTFPLISFPNSNHDFLGFCELYKRNYDWPEDYTAEELWEIDSDISKPDLPPHTRQITEVDYCQSNPDYIYIATGGLFNENSTGLEPKLFKTTIGGNNGDYYGIEAYDPLNYPGIGTDDFPVISGIAVHPTNPDKVWITMIGYDNITERVSYTTDGGLNWHNADPTNSLPQLPINGIVYHYGSNDGLYIATDVGVYYKNAEMDDWIEYGEFPHVRVVELSIESAPTTHFS